MNPRDIRISAVRWHALPVTLRLPLKFGHETVTSVVCARVCVTVEKADGSRAEGWGETPLSVQWVWPSPVPYDVRSKALHDFCDTLTEAYAAFGTRGHPMEIGHDFLEEALPGILNKFNAGLPEGVAIPTLAALVCCSPFDLALHDAYGVAHGVPTYST